MNFPLDFEVDPSYNRSMAQTSTQVAFKDEFSVGKVLQGLTDEQLLEVVLGALKRVEDINLYARTTPVRTALADEMTA